MRIELSLLIVDDEIPIRQELCMYDWEKFGVKVIGEAENGLKALEFCHDNTPDIVLTDITMPIMDGLTLIEKLKEQHPDVQAVILTCHNQFEYARQAVMHGAIGYILKSLMDQHEIGLIIEKARKNIQHKQSYSRRLQEAKKLAQVKAFNLMATASPDLTATYLRDLSDIDIHIKFPCRIVKLCILSTDYDWFFIDKRLQEFFYKMEDDVQGDIPWIPSSVGEYLFFFDFVDQNNLALLQEKVLGIINSVEAIIEDEFVFIASERCICAVISETVMTSTEYPTAFKELAPWRSLIFYEPTLRIFSGAQEPFNSIRSASFQKIYEKINKLNGVAEAMIQFVRTDFKNWAVENRIIPEELKNFVFMLMNQWKIDATSDDMEFRKQILEASSLDGLISCMSHFVVKWSCVEKRCHLQIRLAKKIIAENLEQPISLPFVAERIELSPQYLSRLFAEELGEPFNEFVTKLRMEKAADLLKTTNMKVYEIAEQVGIPNYRYFSVVFKKWTGVTPKEFKKQ